MTSIEWDEKDRIEKENILNVSVLPISEFIRIRIIDLLINFAVGWRWWRLCWCSRGGCWRSPSCSCRSCRRPSPRSRCWCLNCKHVQVWGSENDQSLLEYIRVWKLSLSNLSEWYKLSMDQLVLDKIRVIQWTKSKVIVEGNVWVKPVMLLFSLIKQREIC